MLDTAQPVPFDFLINGTFLTSTLEAYLEKHGLSFETNITLQYVRSLIPPKYEASFEHDDWVSAVDVLSATSPAGRWTTDPAALLPGHDRILSASYDGLLRIWNPSGDVLATSAAGSHGGHTASVKAAKFLSSTQLASAGLDRTVRVWKYTEAGAAGELKPTLELYGHTASIDSLAVDGASKRILTAAADGAIGLWSTTKASAPAAPRGAPAGLVARQPQAPQARGRDQRVDAAARRAAPGVDAPCAGDRGDFRPARPHRRVHRGAGPRPAHAGPDDHDAGGDYPGVERSAVALRAVR